MYKNNLHSEYTVPEALGMDPTVDSSHSTGTIRRGEMNMPNFIRIIRREQRNEEPENANAVVELPTNNTSQAEDQVQQLDVWSMSGKVSYTRNNVNVEIEYFICDKTFSTMN